MVILMVILSLTPVWLWKLWCQNVSLDVLSTMETVSSWIIESREIMTVFVSGQSINQLKPPCICKWTANTGQVTDWLIDWLTGNKNRHNFLWVATFPAGTILTVLKTLRGTLTPEFSKSFGGGGRWSSKLPYLFIDWLIASVFAAHLPVFFAFCIIFFPVLHYWKYFFFIFITKMTFLFFFTLKISRLFSLQDLLWARLDSSSRWAYSPSRTSSWRPPSFPFAPSPRTAPLRVAERTVRDFQKTIKTYSLE